MTPSPRERRWSTASDPGLSIGARALLAIVLMAAFYGLALAVVGFLLWLPYAEYIYLGRLDAKVALFCILAAGSILWSIVPRIDRFPPPGPLLTRKEEPRVFDLAAEVAGMTGQAMPSEVYLIPDVNAWVAQRGGVMGIGSRRVMGLGLPLLHSFTVNELKAVLAHEFGHFHSGDTRLGPWVYKTRDAIGRTVAALQSEESIGLQIVQAPFEAYGTMFLRVSHAVSRSQEHAADSLAARVVGARHLASGLKVVHAVAPLYDLFWRAEFAPLLGGGFAPPLGEGLRSFLAAGEIRALLEETLGAVLEQAESDPLDTHPALKLRLEAIGERPEATWGEPGPVAASILNDEESLERRLFAHFLGEETASRLKRVAWAHVGDRFYRPLLERNAGEAAPVLKGVTPELLPDIATQFLVRQERLLRAKPGEEYFRDQGEAATLYLGAALTLAAVQAGCEIVSRPCRPVLIRSGGEDIDFFGEFEKLRSKQADAARWAGIISKTGIGGIDLGTLQWTAPAG